MGPGNARGPYAREARVASATAALRLATTASLLATPLSNGITVVEISNNKQRHHGDAGSQ
jgi:hypothetical protein